MQDTNAIIHAFSILGDGRGAPLTGTAISQEIKDDRLAWVHMDARLPETREWLQKEISYLDHIIIDALLADETRPRIVEFEEGAVLILRGANLNDNASPEDMVSIRLWIDKSRIISIQRRGLKAITDIKNRLLDGTGPKNSGDFIATLSARLFDRMEPIFSELDESLDDVEENVIENPSASDRQDITQVRKKAILFRRYIAPQRDVIAHLRTSDMVWIDQMHKRRLQESLDQVIRYVEDLDSIRERAQIVKDELANILADKLNKNLYFLSVVAAIFLPLGFLTGLLGINVPGIPGAENPNAFLIFALMLVGIVVGQVALFKKLKWF